DQIWNVAAVLQKARDRPSGEEDGCVGDDLVFVPDADVCRAAADVDTNLEISVLQPIVHALDCFRAGEVITGSDALNFELRLFNGNVIELRCGAHPAIENTAGGR